MEKIVGEISPQIFFLKLSFLKIRHNDSDLQLWFIKSLLLLAIHTPEREYPCECYQNNFAVDHLR